MALQRAASGGGGRDGAGNSGDGGHGSLIEYPSRFPIKVIGLQTPGFAQAMAAVARNFDPGFDQATMEHRPSSAGKYLGITITITATSREQLDELYRTLSTHPMVKFVL